MEILCHRGFWQKQVEQNSLASFKKALELGYGIELDIRDFGSNIVIAHDLPNNESALFSNFFDQLNNYEHNNKTIAINIKSDGLVSKIKGLINEYELADYFTFDMSIPEMLRYQNAGLNYFTRLSEYEKDPIMIENATGIWLDAFETEWYDEDYLNGLLQNKKDICIVSAELHGRDYTNQWALIKGLNDQNNLMLCTDKPNEAREYFR